MNKYSSILDYQHEELSPDLWDNSKVLNTDVKNFILTSYRKFCSSNNLKDYELWTVDGFLASSLCTYFYKDDTDFDVKFVINLDLFIKANPKFSSYTVEELTDYLISLGRNSYYLTQYIPGTQHAMDPYFYDTAVLDDLNLNKFDCLYQLSSDKWIKEPKKLVAGLSQSYIIDYAQNIAEKYIDEITKDISAAKRSTIDFLILKDYIKDLEPNDLEALQKEFEKRLSSLEDDIEQLEEDKEIVKSLRKREYTKESLESELERLMGSYNYSDGNLIYKLLQRYGYLKILYEVSEFYKKNEITPSSVDELLVLLAGLNG